MASKNPVKESHRLSQVDRWGLSNPTVGKEIRTSSIKANNVHTTVYAHKRINNKIKVSLHIYRVVASLSGNGIGHLKKLLYAELS